jgi:hypothetical protein
VHEEKSAGSALIGELGKEKEVTSELRRRMSVSMQWVAKLVKPVGLSERSAVGYPPAAATTALVGLISNHIISRHKKDDHYSDTRLGRRARATSRFVHCNNVTAYSLTQPLT